MGWRRRPDLSSRYRTPSSNPLLDTDVESLDMSPRRDVAVTGGISLRPIAKVRLEPHCPVHPRSGVVASL